MHSSERRDKINPRNNSSVRTKGSERTSRRRGNKLSTKQRKLLQLLNTSRGETLSPKKILDETGYLENSFRVMFSNGLYDHYLKQVSPRRFQNINPTELDERTFRRQVSQTKAHRELGSDFKNPLARKLVEKSQENIILALELYNRPSLTNRLDAFAQLFCTAWEQLLKAEILNDAGEERIYEARKAGRRRETIPLQQCIDMQRSSPDEKWVRKNVLTISELRHSATHLLMRETATPVSQLFQAGVLNFSRRFVRVVGQELLPPSSSGLLALVGASPNTSAVDLNNLYTSITAKEIQSFSKDLSTQIKENTSDELTIDIIYRLALSKQNSQGDISLPKASGSDKTLGVFEKVVPAHAKYPNAQKQAVAKILKALGSRFTSYDFQALIFVKKWKNSDNEFHFFDARLNCHCDSNEALDRLLEILNSEPSHLEKARDKYKTHLRSKKAQRTSQKAAEVDTIGKLPRSSFSEFRVIERGPL